MRNRFIICGVLLSWSLIAAPVDLNKAQRVASYIYAERSNTGTMDGFNLRSVDILDENDVNLIYVFQLESEGFILVSGDDRVQPMLAYSFESPFIMEDVPSNVAWMIDAYKKMVKNAIISDESATEKVNAEWEKYFTGNGLNSRNRDIIGPLLESHFNQSANWNDYCPGGTSCSGDQVPNGCVAVAMSAIMHYWAYPVTGEGDNQCYCGGFGTQSADFDEAVYAPLYYGYGGPGEYADRSWYARHIEADIMHKAPDTVLVHVKADADVIRKRMKENPHNFSLLQDKDIETVLAGFAHHYEVSFLRHKFDIDTSTSSIGESICEFVGKLIPHLQSEDRQKIMFLRK